MRGFKNVLPWREGPAAVRMPRGAGNPVAVFAGGWHSFAITDKDKVVGWGLNNWGQLGGASGQCHGMHCVNRLV
jgi:alpha-tubulin suppressor-like RCC1 family protein